MNRLGLIAMAGIVFSLFSGSSVLATETVSFDSVWWNGLTVSEQTFAVEGAMDGYISGSLDGQIRYNEYLYARSANVRQFKGLGTVADAITEAAHSYKPTFAAFGKTFGTYIHGISDFYANHPEASKATVGEIMGCLADKPRQTCDQVAKWRSTH